MHPKHVALGMVILGLLAVSVLPGCPTACTGRYKLTARYLNADSDPVHLFRTNEGASEANRVVPGASERRDYEAEWFGTVDDLFGEDESEICARNEQSARANPHTWTFVAARGGVTLGTASLIVTYDDAASAKGSEIAEIHVDVHWNGSTLTATRVDG